MATSESDDFESADEELKMRRSPQQRQRLRQRQRGRSLPSVVDSESDDDNECIPVTCNESRLIRGLSNPETPEPKSPEENVTSSLPNHKESKDSRRRNSRAAVVVDKLPSEMPAGESQESAQLAKSPLPLEESEMPEELRSDKKFKEVFVPKGWESIGNAVQLSEDLREQDFGPVLDRLSTKREEDSASWGSWGNWGVGSLLNTATAGVSTITSRVSHGLALLEESIGAPDPRELAREEARVVSDGGNADESQAAQALSFGLGDLISGVSSITKLVESTGSSLLTGGLDTLETIGKKTMEVLQEGDPGLKKKRAFLAAVTEKPNLSSVLREAKEKADRDEGSVEERRLARKVHFESLFDDFQGLVHLEALEILSKLSDMKIQQRLVHLEGEELTSAQETLREVTELCDLGDDEEDEEGDLDERLEAAARALGVDASFERLEQAWRENERYSGESRRETFQAAIAALASFTAQSVERFQKIAELLLVKERRSTVDEADSLVRLTKIFSGQIGAIANLFVERLRKFESSGEEAACGDTDDTDDTDVTAVFLEAANASSYVQDAFRLLVPILQVGAI